MIPSDISGNLRFPKGYLQCADDGVDNDGACKASSNSKFWKFRNANDYLICRSSFEEIRFDIVGRSCSDHWLVENLGAACCTGGQTCTGAALHFRSDRVNQDVPEGLVGTCLNDACCDGESACIGAEMKAVRTLTCRGLNTCSESTASIISNLYCSGQSGIGWSGGNTCRSQELLGSFASFTFNNMVNGAELGPKSHCVTCIGNSVCNAAEFLFDTRDAPVKLNCAERGSCQSAFVNIRAANVCVEVNCASGPQPCWQLQVIFPNGEADRACHCTGDATWCSQIANPTKCPYSPLANPCGFTTNICEEPSACCDSVASPTTPDCGNCQCTPVPTTKSTTKSTTQSTTESTSIAAQAEGDPHIDTFDGQHYTLLKQGSFSFWHFSGPSASVVNPSAVSLVIALGHILLFVPSLFQGPIP